MNRSTYHRIYRLGLALTFGALLLPLGARAQIASPFNAGGNSGNNSLGSSTTSIGTPDFTSTLESQSEDVTVEPDGSLTAPAEKLEEVGAAIRSTLSQPEAQTTNLANQLVASGLQPPKANQLVSLLVGLSQQPNLNQLSAAINLFNQVIRESSPEVLNSLRSNPAFVAISATLRSARSVLGS